MLLPSTTFWKDRTVFVTGHMGFKGSWLVALLATLGARTIGFGEDDRSPLLYRTLDLPDHRSIVGNVNSTELLVQALVDSAPSVLLHLAAQPIVLDSYENPLGTFRDNIMGTASTLEAARHAETLKAIIVVTSDKVYENRGWAWGYRESDALGGHDPYSASKASAEIVAQSMRRSFFDRDGAAAVVTARAGNVIGGGDWASYRLLPDAARAFSRRETLQIRNPHSTRPWQHVLEPLVGYLQLAERLVKESVNRVSHAWNFGPAAGDVIPVSEVVEHFAREWGPGVHWLAEPGTISVRREATVLAVDASLARSHLGWSPRWGVAEAVRRTAAWYRDHAAGADANELVSRDIAAYFKPPSHGEGQ